LQIRGMGFNERILEINRRRFERFSGPDDRGRFSPGYAEAFEIELFGFS
jgi:hypothetical protein